VIVSYPEAVPASYVDARIALYARDIDRLGSVGITPGPCTSGLFEEMLNGRHIEKHRAADRLMDALTPAYRWARIQRGPRLGLASGPT